jgi:hypothetical protein
MFPMPLTSGTLGGDAPDPLVDRSQHQHVAAAVAGSPYPDAVGLDLREGLRVGDRVAVVADLRPRVDLLARLAVAGAEVAVVEHQRPKATGGERLTEAVEIHLLDGGEAVRHHDRGDRPGGPVGQVQPATQGHALGVELDVLSHRDLLGQRAGCRV